jgi:CO dehydrogenase/acetyl-CoA synthase alpha subunit
MTGKIRKIVLGQNPKLDGKAIMVGTYIGHLQSEIVEIVRDKNYFVQTEKEKFLVYLKNKAGVKYLWNEVIDIPVLIEYSDPKEDPENHN